MHYDAQLLHQLYPFVPLMQSPSASCSAIVRFDSLLTV